MRMAHLIPSKLIAAMQAAVELHLEGRLEDAEAKYRKVLRLDPANYDAHHLLGIIRLQQARPDEAVAFLREALRRRPDAAEPHYNLGVLLKDLAAREEAVGCLRKALAIRPDYPEALDALGLALYGLERWEEAAACHERAVALKPNDIGAICNLGNALLGLDRQEEAAACYRKAVALAPGNAEAHNNLGVALNALGRAEDAVACHRQALRIEPRYAEAHNNLGVALQALDQYDAAADAYARALALEPDYPEAHNNQGLLLADLNRHGEALAAYERAVLLRPGNADAYFNRGLARLALGDYEAGWGDYEWRWRTKPFLSAGASAARPPGAPRWEGEDLAGKTLLLHAEQGLGDTLQFARYAAPVAASGARVVLEVQAPLKPLLARLEGVSEIIVMGEPRPSVDLHCPLLSLPRILGTRLETIPAPATGLLSPSEKRAAWQCVLADLPRPRVGLVWAGSPTHKQDRRRSLPLQALLPLASVPGVSYVGLQKELRPGDAALLQACPAIRHLGDRLADFTDTAALLSELDLLVSIDSSVAHLAGTLGLPCWLLLPFASDWRWLLGREDSPWYPSVRLFRQPGPGDWATVLEGAKAQLRHLAA